MTRTTVRNSVVEGSQCEGTTISNSWVKDSTSFRGEIQCSTVCCGTSLDGGHLVDTIKCGKNIHHEGNTMPGGQPGMRLLRSASPAMSDTQSSTTSKSEGPAQIQTPDGSSDGDLDGAGSPNDGGSDTFLDRLKDFGQQAMTQHLKMGMAVCLTVVSPTEGRMCLQRHRPIQMSRLVGL